MKRTAIKRSTKRLPWKSAKREAITDERRAFVERLLSERRGCEGPLHLRSIVSDLDDRDQRVVVAALRACTHVPTEVHEKRKRSRGGSIIDDENCLVLDRSCHQFTEDEPRLATMAGLLIPSWHR